MILEHSLPVLCPSTVTSHADLVDILGHRFPLHLSGQSRLPYPPDILGPFRIQSCVYIAYSMV